MSSQDKFQGTNLGKKGPRKSKYDPDPLAHYYEHFGGLSRSQLQKECSGLYNRLRTDGLIEHVPTLSKRYDPEDPLATYNEMYFGMRRSDVKKENPGLYNRLSQLNLLDLIFSSDDDQEL